MERTTISLSRAVASPANAIFIVDCLSSTDAQSGARQRDGILDELLALDLSRFDEAKQKIQHSRCSNLQEIVLLLDTLCKLCERGVVPLIFINGHGNSEKGLKLASGQFMGWNLLLKKLDNITSSTGGELTVIAAFCHSMAAIKHIDRSVKLPFAFYYGYESIIPAGIVEEEMKTIYKSLLRDGGKSLNVKQLQISGYSEYDHVNELLACAIMLAEAPGRLSTIEPKLAKGVLRKEVEKKLAAAGVPLSGIGKFFKQAVQGRALAIDVIMRFMHDTERRRRYLNDITRQIGGDGDTASGNSGSS